MKKSSGIIVKSNNKILFCKRADNFKWSVPMGGVEENETPKDTAYREFYEETNLEITGNIKYVGKILRRKKGIIKNILYLFLLNTNEEINPNLEKASDGFEHISCKYFNMFEINYLNMDKSIREITSKVFFDF